MSLTFGPVSASGFPFLDNCAVTRTRKISEANIAEFISNVQVSITLEPMIWRELATSLVIATEDGGTA